MTCPIRRIHIRSEGDLHPAVIEVLHAAREAGFSHNRQLAVATCASEIATNILKYAGRGWVGTGPLMDGQGMQLTAEDRGPGIANIQLAMQDHYSTSGSLGLGLPGVRRMADEFEIASEPNHGTKLVARFYPETCARLLTKIKKPVLPRRDALEVASHQRAYQGGSSCGDRAIIKRDKDQLLLAVVDGLGHGEPAALAAGIAARVIEQRPDCAALPTELLGLVDAELREQRATAAMAIIRVDAHSGDVRAAGVGNILMARFSGRALLGDTRLLCGHGVLGRQWRKPPENRVHLAEKDLLLLASDGLPSRFSPADLPALRYGTPAVLATLAVERFGKPDDDCCCLLARWHP